MPTNINLTVSQWPDYELLDSGGNLKLERFGKAIISRPETQAIWKPMRPELWPRADAEFHFAGGKGLWTKRNKNIPEAWEVSWKDLRFIARLTSFKHVGIFPEQAANWEWVAARSHDSRVLNLFGYTGLASIVAAKAGANVTHVDASKTSNTWAKENAKLSGVPDDSIRWILDDALRFAKREVRRGAKYDGIILDPPAFGRGAKGEVWKIEEDLLELLETLKLLLAETPGSFFLLNGYAAGYAPISFLQLVESIFGKVNAEYGELHMQEYGSERVIPAGMYVRFVVR